MNAAQATAYLEAMGKPEFEPVIKIHFKLLTPTARLPEYKTSGAAGMDLFIDEDLFLLPGDTKIVPTGLAVEIPLGYEGQIRTRSSIGKLGYMIPNSPATIDSDYRGPLGILIHRLYNPNNSMNEPLGQPQFRKGDRIAQLVICPVARAMITQVDTLTETARGTGGFGSTGKS